MELACQEIGDFFDFFATWLSFIGYYILNNTNNNNNTSGR